MDHRKKLKNENSGPEIGRILKSKIENSNSFRVIADRFTSIMKVENERNLGNFVRFHAEKSKIHLPTWMCGMEIGEFPKYIVRKTEAELKQFSSQLEMCLRLRTWVDARREHGCARQAQE